MDETKNVETRGIPSSVAVPLTEEEENKIAEAVPALSSPSFMLQNSLKIMKGKHGGGFYVRYLQDAVKKVGWLQLIIEYPNGSCKKVTLYKNGFAETEIDGDGMYVASKPVNRDPKSIIRWGGESITADCYLLEKYAAPDMPIPGRILWRHIRDKYEQIPVVQINRSASVENLYFEMATCAVEYSKNPKYSFMNGSDRYYVPAADFKNIASDNNYSLNDLRCEFDTNGLFIKDKAKGYQYSKRVDGERIRFYVLRKNLPEATGSIKDESMDFETDVISPEENTIKRLLKENAEMQQAISENPNATQKELHLLL